MTLIRKLVSVVCWALLLTGYSASANSQTLDYTTGNIVLPTVQGSGTTPWTGGVYQDSLTCWAGGNPGYCGPNAIVRPGNNINFSYGSTYLYQQQDVSKLVPTNALNVTGYQFGFTAKNGNGWDNGMTDQLTALVRFWDNTGGRGANNLLYGNSWNLSYKYNWTNFNYNETLPTPLSVASIGKVQYGFIGKDNNGWAGPYGPEIYNVSFSLKYSVDPCKLNIASSPTCTGFNNIITSNNVLPQPDTWGTSMNQMVAINTALKNGGIGATVHGFNYGFDYAIGQSWSGCTATNQDGSCSWYMNIPAQASVTAQLTNSNNQSLYSKTHTLTGDGTSGSVSGQYLLPASLSQTSMGNVRLYGSATGTGSSIGNFSASLIYTADPCVSNPLYSTLCSGYAVAYAKNMLLGSTVASASGPIVSSGSTSISTNTGTIDQSSPQQEQTQQTTTSPPPPSSPTPTQDTTMAQADTAQPSPTQAGPAPTGPQPVGGPQTSPQQQQGGSSAGPSSLAMSVLKTAQDKDKATQTAAVQSAAKTLEASMQQSQAASNSAISMNQDMSANSATTAATFASQSTQTSQQTATQTSQSSQQTQQVNNVQQQQNNRVVQQTQQTQQEGQPTQQASSNLVQLQPPQQVVQQVETQTVTTVKMPAPHQEIQQVQNQSNGSVVQIQQATYTPPVQQQQEAQSTAVSMLKPTPPAPAEVQSQASSGTGLVPSRNPFAYNPLGSINIANMGIQPTQTAPVYQPRIQERIIEVEAPQVQVASFSGMGKAGNPLSEMMMQQRFEMMQDNIQPQTSSVNRNVQPNDLAGGIDLASMALQPKGFEAYSFTLRDAAFYEPKEVYKGQAVVDNVRALRQLGSDRLHKEMVDQQYKLGN